MFRAHGDSYRAVYPLTPEQRAAMRAIETCRTEVLGGHVDVCVDCGHRAPSYNSCRNRHCPKCQALSQARWLEARMKRVLPVHYFHVVFTLPAELRPLGLRHRKLIYELLFRAASESLLTLGRDDNRLGALLGVTAVLHTWTRDLQFHPHLHCIVTGGGLATSEERWLATDPNYLFPVKVLSRLFRGKLVDALAREYEAERVELPDEPAASDGFARLRDSLFRKDWVVYAKRPFAGPKQVFSYLGQYTHRVAISNHRLLKIADDTVTIATRGERTATMTPHEFIRRFLLHVLPRGFVKIRHYGLVSSSNVNTKLELARRLLHDGRHRNHTLNRHDDDVPTGDDWQALFERLTGIDVRLCPRCGSRRLVRFRVPDGRGFHSRAPPAVVGASP